MNFKIKIALCNIGLFILHPKTMLASSFVLIFTALSDHFKFSFLDLNLLYAGSALFTYALIELIKKDK